MATPQLSPGVLVREVDLTVGRAENVLDNIGAIAGPFPIGPINEPITIETQQQLLDTFGKPISSDRQYEYWMTANSFLSYGGILKVVRTNNASLRNSNAGVGQTSSASLKIKNLEDYETNFETSTDFYWAAKNSGTWADTLKVCTIDNKADQIIGITTTDPSLQGFIVGYGITQSVNGSIPGTDGTSTNFSGALKGIITGVSTDSVNGASTAEVKIVSRIDSAGNETAVTYQQFNTVHSFRDDANVTTVNNNAGTVSSVNPASATDWYDSQTLGLENSTVFWKSIAGRPVTNNYVSKRSGSNDAIHVAVVDDTGNVTGIQGNILETFTFLSKAKDATADGDNPTRIYYKDFIAQNSKYIFAGKNPSSEGDSFWKTTPVASGFSTSYTAITTPQGLWGQEAQDVSFSSLGKVTYPLAGGKDYGSNGDSFEADLSDVVSGYSRFANKDEIDIDYLIMGPGGASRAETQAKANYLISIAEDRKDCVATISPQRGDVVDVTSSATQTERILQTFSAISSSSYAIFDSGYKYTFDRFNNVFRYIPTNGDVAGLCVRTSIEAFPWFSPAGLQRGVLNNAVKLAYNPTKAQRDVLYGSRINSIITQRGAGIVLFGDKTGLGFSSAFDRINVRRLFLTVEQALEGAANAQLFELNDANTRANFVNIVEPYLRDVQAKRGIIDFLVVCDETNNTPDVIDNNEFRADIFLKPSKSINYVTLTFVATRTGVDFQEVVGSV
jgi:hypothetical protein